MDSDKKFLAKGALINGLGLVIRTASPLLIILLARLFSQRDLGLFLSFQALVLTLARIPILGLEKGLLWHIPRTRGAAEIANLGVADSVRICFLLNAVLFVVFALAGTLGNFQSLQEVSTPFILLMAGTLLPYSVVQIFSGALEGMRLPQYRVILGQFLPTALVPILAISLRGVLGGERSLAAGLFLGYAVGFLLFIPAILKRFPGEKWLRFSLPHPGLLRYSLPLAGMELVSGLLARVDLWMILMLLGPEKAAVYAMMVTLANGLRTVRQTFDPILMPVISGLKSGELGTKLRGSFSYATNMVSTWQLFIACFILVFSTEILSLTGKDYAIGNSAFALLLIGNLANGFLGLNGLVMLGIGKSKMVFYLIASALILNLVGNWIFIPRLGISGAALAASLALLYQNLIQYAYVRFVRGLSLYEPHLYANAAMELAFIALFFSAFRWIEALSLGARTGVFAVTILILGGTVFLKRRTYSLK